MIDISGPVHLVGIGGIHMSAIGQLLMEQGVKVSGSDQRLTPLTDKIQQLGASVFEGHAAENLPADTRLVVTTAAASDDNPEIAAARERGIPVVMRAEMVARLMAGKKVIAVAGSHGKTTTSSMVAFILKKAGLEPMYLLGGESIDLDGHAAWGNGEWCVVEADEYKNAFHQYEPQIAIILNVEPDHLDFFGTEAAYHESFKTFARKVKPDGVLLLCSDDAGSRNLETELIGVNFAIESYGFNARDNWMAGKPQDSGERVSFQVVRQSHRLGDVVIPRPGRHLILNGLAAAAAATHAGVDIDDIGKALKEFQGAHRRFELKGEAGGVLVLDDYAHHPTEVRTILDAARTRFGARRIIGVYQPHTYSRIAYLWDEWRTCFANLDALIVVETYAARETPLAGRGAADLAHAIDRPDATYARDFETAARMAADMAHRGDIVMTIGAGDIVEVGPMILELLK